MRYIKILFGIIIIALSSCRSTVPFTSEIQNRYNFTENQLKSVQFYTSGNIILTQTNQIGDATVSDGKLIVSNEKSKQKIIIPKGTPCVLVSYIDNNKFLFGLENGNDRNLLFGYLGGGNYSLMAKDWTNQIAIIKYANTNFTTTNGDVFLKVKMRKLNKLKQKERIVKGRRL